MEENGKQLMEQDYKNLCSNEFFWDLTGIKLLWKKEISSRGKEAKPVVPTFILTAWDTYGGACGDGCWLYCGNLTVELVLESYASGNLEQRYKVLWEKSYEVLASEVLVQQVCVAEKQDGAAVAVKHDGVFDLFYKAYAGMIDPHQNERKALLDQGVIGWGVYESLQPRATYEVKSLKNLSANELVEKYHFVLET